MFLPITRYTNMKANINDIVGSSSPTTKEQFIVKLRFNSNLRKKTFNFK